MIVGTKTATIVDNERLVGHANFIVKETTKVGNACCGRMLLGVYPMAYGIEHGCGLGVGTILPHFLHHLVDGKGVGMHGCHSLRSWSLNNLAISNGNTLRTESRLQGCYDASVALVEQTIFRE